MRRCPVLALAAGLLLAGCALGERPTLSSTELAPGDMTGQAPIDAVLALLDRGSAAAGFTATYDVLRTFGGVQTTAMVTTDGTQRSVTVGTVRIISRGGQTTTCRLAAAAPCSAGADLAALSDTGVTTPEFYADGAARRLRLDAKSVVGPPQASTKEFAGQPATCVAVPLPAGTSLQCALANGIVAESDDGAVHVTLTEYSPSVDTTLFSTTG